MLTRHCCLLSLLVAIVGVSCSKSSAPSPSTASQTNTESNAAEPMVDKIPKTYVGTWKFQQLRGTNGSVLDIRGPSYMILTSDGRMIMVSEGKPQESVDRWRLGTGSVLFATYPTGDMPWWKTSFEAGRLVMTSAQLSGPSHIYTRISSSTNPAEIQK